MNRILLKKLSTIKMKCVLIIKITNVYHKLSRETFTSEDFSLGSSKDLDTYDFNIYINIPDHKETNCPSMSLSKVKFFGKRYSEQKNWNKFQDSRNEKLTASNNERF